MIGAILGIDPGTSCGWALLDPAGTRIGSGVWDLRPRRHEGGGMRYVRVRRLLAELLDSSSVAEVYIEEVRRHLGCDAAHVFGGIVAVLQAECEAHEIPYAGVPVATRCRVATGSGRASKEAVIAAALVRWPALDASSLTDDEADALWIAEVGRRGLV